MGFYRNRGSGWAGAKLEAKKRFGTFTVDVAATEVRSGCDLSSGLFRPFKGLSRLTGENPSLLDTCKKQLVSDSCRLLALNVSLSLIGCFIKKKNNPLICK